MFIRKRINHTKRYGTNESYQVLESYRENGKVKQKVVVNLGRLATPELALEKARADLEGAKESIAIWEERMKYTSTYLLHGRKKWYYEALAKAKQRARALEEKIPILESVVSHFSKNMPKSDTTG